MKRKFSAKRFLAFVTAVLVTLSSVSTELYAEEGVPSEEFTFETETDFKDHSEAVIGDESLRSFDIQENDYRRSSRSLGVGCESKWEGVTPYGPLFGEMINYGRYTRPLGRKNGDLGYGWGSSDWMTGYLSVDASAFGTLGTDGLPLDESNTSIIGIVRVDKKYERTDRLDSWKEDLTEAFKGYNGNYGFGEHGWGDSAVDQETKLVIWDGYKRNRGMSLFGKEYIQSVEEIDTANTGARRNFCDYVKEAVTKGGKIHGTITVTEGIKNLYEPSRVKYRNGRHQIIKIPQIKITAVTYDVKIEHKDAPADANLPELLEVRAGDPVVLPKLQGYHAEWTDKNGAAYEPSKIEGNLELVATWSKEEEEREKEPLEDIGELYFKEAKDTDVEMDEETGMQYVKDQILISAYPGVNKSLIQEIIAEFGGEIVGFIELSNDYQIEFKEKKTFRQLNEISEYLNGLSFISNVTLNSASDMKMEAEAFGSNDRVYNDNYRTRSKDYNEKIELETWDENDPKGDNWGLEALRVPSAWKLYKPTLPVKVGIYDGGFDENHEDLNFEYVFNNPFPIKPKEERKYYHGTHVAGILAAKHNNRKGISGIATNTRLYAYAANGANKETAMGWKAALARLIGSRVKVINISRGYWDYIVIPASNPEIAEKDPILKRKFSNAREMIKKDAAIFSEYLHKMLLLGYDFVICTSAGNENNKLFVIDYETPYGVRIVKSLSSDQVVYQGKGLAYYGNPLTAIKETEVKKRILVIGSIQNDGKGEYSLAYDSNFDERVDFVAPGVDIASSTPFNNYLLQSGTSMASPHITSLVAMMYQVNPLMKASDVKDLLKASSKKVTKYDYLLPDAVKCCEKAKSADPDGKIHSDWPVGLVTGVTKDSEGDSLGNVSITALKLNHGEDNVKSYRFLTVSNNEGTFLEKIPSGQYDILVSKEGYYPYMIQDVKIYPDITTTLMDLKLSPIERFHAAIIKGRVKDAVNGAVLKEATVKLRKGWNNKTGGYLKGVFKNTTEQVTDKNGDFNFFAPVGTYTAEVSKGGYTTGYFNVICKRKLNPKDEVRSEMILSPVIPDNEYRIILTWGDSPRDLDSHLTYIEKNRELMHVSYSNKSGTTNFAHANLDVDDTSGFGPETITLKKKGKMPERDSRFRYYVFNYSYEGAEPAYALSLSNATVRVYRGSELINIFYVPKKVKGRTWEVFEINAKGVKPVNKIN